MALLLYKGIQLTILVLFALFISDIRTKPGMVPLVKEGYIVLLKLCAPLPIVVYGWTLLIMQTFWASDVGAFILACIGTILVVKAKLDLGDHHTWVGYHLPHREPIDWGLYRHMKHPMYTGIIVMIIAGLLTFWPRLPWYCSMLATSTIIYIIAFLVTVARRETQAFVIASQRRNCPFRA